MCWNDPLTGFRFRLYVQCVAWMARVEKEVFFHVFNSFIVPMNTTIQEQKSGSYEIQTFTIRVNENPEGEDLSAPEKVYNLAREILKREDQDKEHFYILLLDAKNKLKSVKHVSTGTLTSSLVHPREVYRPAIMAGSAGIIAFHNHPSGDPDPSKEDIEITERLEEVGDLIGIDLLDHVIISEQDNSYRSFQDLDLL